MHVLEVKLFPAFAVWVLQLATGVGPVAVLAQVVAVHWLPDPAGEGVQVATRVGPVVTVAQVTLR